MARNSHPIPFRGCLDRMRNPTMGKVNVTAPNR